MTNGYAQWAPQYRAKLWTGVLPLPPNAKAPTPKGYTGRAGKTPDDDQIAAWCRQRANGNIALRMPGDVLGIDVDDYTYERWEEDETGEAVRVRGTKTGAATLAALEAELGPLPPTWRSSSRGDGPSGIRLFRVPPGLLWGDFGTHLEGIWWGHRYAVVYPSVNPDSGLQYLWINDGADQPRWGAEPPKITELSELPESWTARFGRSADAPVVRTAAAAREGRTALPPTGDRKFTRAQAEKFVMEGGRNGRGLNALAAAQPGEINNRLNDAAKIMSHFVPAFWSPMKARTMLAAALSSTAYDHPPSAHKTIESAFDSAHGDWVAELVADPPPRAPRRAAADQEPPADEPPTDDAMGDAIDGFWDRRPFLRHLHTYARSRYTAPWAVLGSTLALAVAAVEPNILLPAVIGREASLNLFVGLVGPSGGGKDIAFGVAEELLDVRFGGDPIKTEIIPLGSGEGISHVYMKHPPKLAARRGRKGDDEDSEAIGLKGLAATDGEPIQYRTRALLTVSEIDTLDAQTKRQGSTVGGQLRQGWSGSQIGFHYADTNKRMIVPKQAYRMCLVAGIQPGRAQMLLSGPESDGGTPQRFLWLPATDPTMTRDAPITPDPVAWMPPVYNGRVTFDVCATASDTIVDAHVGRQRGDGDALDGHALLTRLKVAAALAMLDARDARMQCTVTDEDWELAGIVMAVSDRTREGVRRHLAEAARIENEKRAYAEAQKTIVITETVEDAGLSKALRWARSKVGSEWVTLRMLTQAIKSTIRPHLGVALEQMLSAGEIESEEYSAKGGPGALQYRRK